ncbi:MAG TPA: single-stranded DNA-binding protein [Lachnospiraceae bacterium]|nr:single-stranded DNA-binding protein [Lachnospiraceae bacterium]
MTNKVIISGYLTKDIELRYKDDKTAYCNFAIVNHIADRSRKDIATLIICFVHGKKAENMKRYLRKGSKVTVVGKLQEAAYRGESIGQYALQLYVEEIDFDYPMNQRSETNDEKVSDGQAFDNNDTESSEEGMKRMIDDNWREQEGWIGNDY